MNKTLLFLLLPGLLISCKPTPPSGDNGEIVPLTSECLLKNSDLYMKYLEKFEYHVHFLSDIQIGTLELGHGITTNHE